MTALTMVNLRAEAIGEAGRLTRARMVTRDGDARTLDRLEGEATWTAAAKRGRVKRALRGRTCLIWRAAFEDGSGRRVETRLVATLVDADLEARGQAASDRLRTLVDAACADWRNDVVRTTRAFSTARLEREESIAATARSADPPAQPGLFDRRVERVRSEREQAAAGDYQVFADRHARIASGATIVPVFTRLLLVLVP